MVIAGASDREHLDVLSTLSHVEILTSGSSATCHFDKVQNPTGETGEEYDLDSSANVERGSGNTFLKTSAILTNIDDVQCRFNILFVPLFLFSQQSKLVVFSIVYFTQDTFHMCSEAFIVSPNHQD